MTGALREDAEMPVAGSAYSLGYMSTLRCDLVPLHGACRQRLALGSSAPPGRITLASGARLPLPHPRASERPLADREPSNRGAQTVGVDDPIHDACIRFTRNVTSTRWSVATKCSTSRAPPRRPRVGRVGRRRAPPPEVRATLSEPFGKTHVEPLGDAAYALIPTENYQSSQIYRVDADDGQPLFSTRGWATRLFRLR